MSPFRIIAAQNEFEAVDPAAMEWRPMAKCVMILEKGKSVALRRQHGAGAMTKRTAIAFLMALSASTAAFAETQEEQQACTNDAFQFCQDAIPDRDRVFACLAQKRHVISPPCQAVMAQYLPAEPVAKKPAARKIAKNKGPLSLAPH
jgi:hypothetical protein